MINPNTGLPFDPISDERLRELDSWYAKQTSNSLMFCDGDYFEMRARLDRLRAIEAAAKDFMRVWDSSPSDAYWNKACQEARERLRILVGEG